MAGSYKHVVTQNGNLRSNESFVDMIENLGDAYEMAEEMYGMIWYIAYHFGAPGAPLSEVKAIVEVAQKNYKEGLEMAKEVNRQR